MRAINKNRLIEASQQRGSHTRLASWETKTKGLLAALTMPLLLAGCEAPLNLNGVENELTKSVRRTDQLMAVTVAGDKVVIAGSDGLILSSDRAQLNWQRQELEQRPNFVAIDTCPDNSMIALSMEHQVWISSDQGVSWDMSELPTYESLISLTCGPDNSYWASGSFSTFMSSHDQGTSWQELSLNEDATITSVQFLDNNRMIATGEFGLVARSEDAGQNWAVQEPIPNEFFPQGSYFKNSDTGWVAGLGGTILHTSDGGLSWNPQQTPTESPLYGFYANDTRLFAFGDHGTVLELKGQQWARLDSPKIPVYLRDGMQISADKLLVAGGWGSLFTIDIKQ